jgi:phosphopentomutase
MARVIITLLDSFGIGYAHDAEAFGDRGADTLGHIAAWMAENRKGPDGKPQYLYLPHLAALGLEKAHALSMETSLAHPLSGQPVQADPLDGGRVQGAYTCAEEISKGKDTLSGHWEIAGVPVRFNWGYFPDKPHCFPPELMENLIREGGLPGVLGEKHASGTVIIQELGEEHMRTGKPIVYTSADSVLQIACHEETFGLERLYDLCRLAYRLVQPYKIARVIARPFVGTRAGSFERVAAHRHDFAVPAHEPTLLDNLVAAGGQVYAVGKIADIFAHRGISKHYPAAGLDKIFDATVQAVKDAPDHSLVFSNFVDFDSSYGHRRDVLGYGEGLEMYDRRLPELLSLLGPEDVLLVTADHGCDPTWKGTDHTREKIPVLFYGQPVQAQQLAPLHTFSDIGQTLASYLKVKPLGNGRALDIWKR